MRLNIGSTNKVKIEALQEIVKDYPYLKDAEIFSIDAPSGVSNQPKSLEETVQGAMNRAKTAFKNCDYSFGIEAGLMQVPHSKTGYMNVNVCAIFDGEDCFLGLSSAWEAPEKVTEHMIKDGLEMDEAVYRAGLSTNPRVGRAEGLVGILTKGRLTRKEYMKEAIRTALIHLEKTE